MRVGENEASHRKAVLVAYRVTHYDDVAAIGRGANRSRPYHDNKRLQTQFMTVQQSSHIFSGAVSPATVR